MSCIDGPFAEPVPVLTIYTEANNRAIGKTLTHSTTASIDKETRGPATGVARVCSASVEALAKALDRSDERCFGSSCALMFGVPASGEQEVTVKPQDQLELNDTPRNRESWVWPVGAGYMFIDIDSAPWMEQPCHGATVEARAWGILRDAIGAAADSCGVVFAESATSRAYDNFGNVLPPSLHFLIPVADASDIPRAGAVLLKRLWLMGHGSILVSKSGSLLLRNLIDGSVWQPSRICYASVPAAMGCDIRLSHIKPAARAGNLLRTQEALHELPKKDEARYERLVSDAKKASAPERKQKRALWLLEHFRLDPVKTASAAITPLPVPEELTVLNNGKAIFEAMDAGILPGSLVLYPLHGSPVRVRDVVDKWDQYRGQRLADPIEPSYRNDKRIACFFDGDTPGIHSHAHGGQKWRLSGDLVPDMMQQHLADLSRGEWDD